MASLVAASASAAAAARERTGSSSGATAPVPAAAPGPVWPGAACPRRRGDQQVLLAQHPQQGVELGLPELQGGLAIDRGQHLPRIASAQRDSNSKAGQLKWKKRLAAGSCKVQVGVPSGASGPGCRPRSCRSAGRSVALTIPSIGAARKAACAAQRRPRAPSFHAASPCRSGRGGAAPARGRTRP